MTSLLALAILASGPKVVEAIDPTANRLAVQIVVKLPELDARELGMAKVLEDILLDGTQQFTKAQLMSMTNALGMPIRCWLMPDSLRIQYSLPKGSMQAATAIADSVCRHASLSAESLAASLASLPFKNRDYWVEALDPFVAKYERIRLSDLREFYGHLFRPENITIGVAGSFTKGEAEGQFASMFTDWVPAKDTYPRYHFTDFPKEMVSRRRQIATVELSSEAMPEDVGKNVLMASVMGLGKGSVVFRTLREKLALSYRQEAFLWPSASGLQLRVIAVVTDVERARQAEPTMRSEILAAVDALSEEDLGRAKALLRSAWQDGVIGGPIYFDNGRPLAGTPEDAALLAAYGQIKTNVPWSLDFLLSKVQNVSLDDLKKTLKATIESARFRAILPN